MASSTESHSLVLKIDAAPADAGAKKFQSAINAIKQAVGGLERDTEGLFVKLNKISPKVDTSGITKAVSETNKMSGALGSADAAAQRASANMIRTQLASSNAIRVSTNAVQRLRLRLLEVGDTAAIERSTQRLVALGRAAAQASNPLEVRQAKSTFQEGHDTDSRSAINAQEARWNLQQQAQAEIQASKAAALHASELDALGMKYNPLRSASMAYAATLEEINRAESAGVLTSQLASAARQRAAQSLTTASAGNAAYAVSAGQAKFAAQSMAYQTQDVITMALMSANPLQVVASQIFQVSSAMDMAGSKSAALKAVKSSLLGLLSPSTLAVGAVILLTTVLVQLGTSMFGASEPTKTFAEALGDSTSKISALSSATDTLASARLGSLASGYGVVNEALRVHLERLQAVASIEAMTANRDNISAASSQVTTSYLNTDLDDFRNKLGTTNDAARQLMFLLDQVKTANTFESQAKAITKARAFMESLGITLGNSDGAAQMLLASLIKSEDAGMKLKAAAEGSGSAISTASAQTSVWASNMASVASQIGAIVSGLNALSGGAISFAGGRAELIALNAGKSIEAAAQDRARAELDMKLGQEATAAASRGKGAAWIQSGLAAIQRSQFEAQLEQTTALNSARDIARKRDAVSTGGSAGKGGFKALDDSKVTADILKRAQALDVENHALQAVISSTYKSEEAAKLFGEAMVAGNGAVDGQTRAMLAQIDAAALLNEQLTRAAKDPVREFLASVPLWEEASRSIQGSIVNNMSDTLADFFKTGKLNLASFASSVAGTMADILAKQTTGAILGKFGITGAISGGNETARGGQQAAGMIGNSMINAGRVVSNMLHGSLTAGARTVGGTVQTTMSTSGADAGAKLKKGVQDGSTAGSQTLWQALVSALSGGGGGGGFFDVVAGVVGGMYSEGGYSDRRAMSITTLSPAAFNNAPHYAEGTPNTSGIPAVLHPNEAVIPLSRGRKIPVEMSGGGVGGGDTLFSGGINTTVNIDGAGGDLSDPAHAKAMADQVATMINLKVKESMADAARYGGMMNPRGGR